MIYDVFTYNGEKDILDIRLNILSPFVDKFVIIEFDETFSGKKKPKHFLKDWNQDWEKFKDKIEYAFIPKSVYTEYESLAEYSPNVPQGGPAHWKQEFCQKESIKNALEGLDNNDVIFVGDVDEIWDPLKLRDILTYPVKLKLKVYSYYLNNRSTENFWGPIVCQYKDIKDRCLNHLRTNILPKTDTEYGWHFTSMGGHKAVEKKLTDSYTSDSYASQTVIDNLKINIDNNKDFLFRNFTYRIDEESWPKYLKENKDRYKYLMR